MSDQTQKIIGYLTREDISKRDGPVTLYDVQFDVDDVPVVAPWGTMKEAAKENGSLRENDAIWARFYRDGKSLGDICKEFNCGVYDLSPWLTAPLVRAAIAELGPKS